MSENIEDEAVPPVRFDLRNTTGEAGEIELRSRMLGMSPYALITVDDEGFVVEGSHSDMEGLSQILAFVLATALFNDSGDPETAISDEVRDEIRALLAEEDE